MVLSKNNDIMKNNMTFFMVFFFVQLVGASFSLRQAVAQQVWEPAPGVACDKAVRLSSFTKLASVVTESVVAIVTSGSSESLPDAFHELRRIFPDMDSRDKTLGIGSGFVVRSDGLVVTNEHVIAGAKRVWVLVAGVGRKLPARILGSDFRSDVALLKIDSPRPLRALVLADSDSAKVGQWVMAMGNPYGLSHLATKGIISGKGRAIAGLPHGRSRFYDFIQTDAAINRGNSGGPLIDLCGQVIGICTAINARARGIGFAVPSNLVRAVLPHLYEKGHLDRSYLGVNVEDVDWELAGSFGMDIPRGVVVTRVRQGTPADRAKIEIGDVILKIGASVVEGRTDLTWKVATLKAGKEVRVQVLRNGKNFFVTLVPAIRQKRVKVVNQEHDGSKSVSEQKPKLGLKVASYTKDSVYDRKTNAWTGVVVVRADALAAEHGLRLGDIIVEVNGHSVSTPSELNTALREVLPGEMVRFYVLRQQVGHFMALRKSWED